MQQKKVDVRQPEPRQTFRDRMLELATGGIKRLLEAQAEVLP